MSEESKEKDLPQNGGTETSMELKDLPPVPVLENKDDTVADTSQTIDESDDKLDEFSRLELEMAELDKTDDGFFAKNLPLNDIEALKDVKENVSNKDVENEKTDKIELEKKNDDKASIAHQNGKAATDATSSEPPAKPNENVELFDHEDLIAVLKGDTIEKPESIEIEKPKKLELLKDETTATISDLLIEGVTIEGEGEYQIMEVIDDIDEEAENNLPSTSKVLSTSLQASTKTNPTNQKLTPAEVRAMAMEQMAGLNARGPRRRKQDIKPLHIETSELVSTLGADWTDDDDETRADDERPTSSKNVITARKEIPLIPQAVKQEVTSTENDPKPAISPGVAVKKRRRSIGAKISPSAATKTPVAETSDDANSNTAEIVTPVPESIGATGFKRKRVIRRPVIYDPDVPESAYSYAHLVNSSARENRESSVTPKVRSVTPKDSTSVEKRGRKRAATPSQAAAAKKNANESSANAKTEIVELPSTSKQPQRAQSNSPDVGGGNSNGPGLVNKKKKISEIDRLMGDEGAANMLNSLESGRGKAAAEVGDNNKPHKPLMRNRVGNSEKVSKKDVSSTTVPSSTSTPKNKRALKPKPSTSWDYVYQKQNNDDSMIIRRRSNSSYSSNASLHRLSLDGPSGLASKSSNTKSSEQSSDDDDDDDDDDNDNDDDGTSETSSATAISISSRKPTTSKAVQKSNEESNKTSNASGNKNFEFAKPKDAKQNQKTANNRRSKTSTTPLSHDMKKAAPKRGRPSNAERNANADNTGTRSPSSAISPNTLSTSDELIVRKIGKTTHIVFNMNSAQISCTFTPQLMNKFVGALKNLAEDVNCHVVMVTTSSSHFCQGVDYTNLATGSADQRKMAAIVLATATKNFLRSLAKFPKPLVAAIQGSIIGLGVTQLPLFDVVVAADNVSFETPYAKIGQTPEGFCIWESSLKIREATKTKLLWLAEKLSGPDDVASIELIDKIVTLDRLHDETLNIAKKMSEMSSKTYNHMKKLIIEKRAAAISRTLDDEFDEITAQWTSVECFNKFKKMLEAGGHI